MAADGRGPHVSWFLVDGGLLVPSDRLVFWQFCGGFRCCWWLYIYNMTIVASQVVEDDRGHMLSRIDLQQQVTRVVSSTTIFT